MAVPGSDEGLAQAIGLMVERPAIDTALDRASARCDDAASESEFAAAWAEQQRLLKRKLEFDERLRQTRGALAEAASVTARKP